MGDEFLDEGFAPVASGSPFIRDMGVTMLEKLVDDNTRILRVLPTAGQTNSEGYLHGGFVLALADYALSYGDFDGRSRIPAITLNLSVNFLRAARPDQWLEVTVNTRKNSASVLFADGTVTADGKLIAQASGVFRPVRPPAAKS